MDLEVDLDSPKVVKQTATLGSDTKAQQILEVVHHRHHHKVEKDATSKVANELSELSKKTTLIEAAEEVVSDIPEVNHHKLPKVSFLQESTLREGHRHMASHKHVEMKPVA